jgi:hypothetical protein
VTDETKLSPKRVPVDWPVVIGWFLTCMLAGAAIFRVATH